MQKKIKKYTMIMILDKDKLLYYRNLNEYQHGEKGYLRDTCLNLQDQYQKLIENLLEILNNKRII